MTASTETLEVGRTIELLTTPALDRTHFVRYAGASGDFNPMHHDEVFAVAAGYPSVFGHGMLTAGILATALRGWAGSRALARFRVRFVGQVWPGDTLTCTATVTSLSPTALDLAVSTPAGGVVLSGSAVLGPDPVDAPA